MSGFAAVIELATLDGTVGFEVQGEASGSWAGFSASSAGDVNGDGYDDFIIGAPSASPHGIHTGAAYVVFGGSGGFPPNFSLGGLDGTNGFRVSGEGVYNSFGWAVAAAGDVNGDGMADIIISAPSNSLPGVSYAGAAYVVFGNASGFAANIDVSSLNGSNGFKLSGAAAFDFIGQSVASAGDLNGDGIDDLVIGAANADPNGRVDAGAAYVVFGSAGGFSSNLDLSSLDGTNGFRLDGAAASSAAGRSVASAGDVNGDGIDDIVIGAWLRNEGGTYAGASYVVFGSTGGFSSDLDLGALDGTNGFSFTGANGSRSGYSVASAGDVNGDGVDDLIIGAARAAPNGQYAAGTAYVVFGRAAGFASSLTAADLDGTNGFRINGDTAREYLGATVAAAGDVNGDGYGDVIVGAWGSATNGSYSGASFVVFGKAGGFAADLNVSTLDGSNGFKLNGELPGDRAGLAVASAGDINNDGASDLMVGAFLNADNGSQAGAAYIIYGQPPAPVVWTGGAGDETHTGGAGADTLSGGAGNDTLYGLAGNDILNGDRGNDILSGGDGADTLRGGIGNDIVGGDAGDDTLFGGDGNDKLYGGDGTDTLNGSLGADLMMGGAGVDTLNGGDGNDTLDGGTGADVMTGGTGNDVYYVDDAGDQTIELSGEGVDIVRASLSWTLAANIEQLELQGTGNLGGTGNDLANRLTGNSGDNVLSGLGGVDTILGGDGNDTIIGGAANDLMTGGAGADTFVILAESVYASKAPAGRSLEIDFVYDLNKAEGDRLDLSAIDADANTAGDQAFHLVASFTKHAGEMTLGYNAGGGITVLSLDVDGDGRADYQMKITGDVHLDSGGWLL